MIWGFCQILVPFFCPPPRPRVSFSKFSFAVLVFVCFFWQKKWSYTGGENEKNVKKMFFLTKIYPSQIDQKSEKKSFLTKKVTFFVKQVGRKCRVRLRGGATFFGPLPRLQALIFKNPKKNSVFCRYLNVTFLSRIHSPV